jgi:regulator of replication initiation timing
MKNINIGISIKLEKLIGTRMLIQAGSGGGKSGAIRKILEESSGKVHIIILDIEGEFATLREKYDFALVAKDGDIPLNLKYAEALALKLLETRISTIIDLYELKHHERISFVKRFLDAMISSPKELWHNCIVVVDEAHLFCPEGKPSEATSSVIDLCTRGRKRGFCAILATQRISKLHKDAAAECLNKLIGRTGLDIDRDRAGKELGFRKNDDLLVLRNLAEREFFTFGPAISNEVTKFRVKDCKTSFPKMGGAATANPPAPDAIKKILVKLEGIPLEAENELKTTKDLKAEITKLRTENTKLQRPAAPLRTVVDDKAIERAVNTAKVGIDKLYKIEIARIEKEYKQGYIEYQNYIKALQRIYSEYIMKYQQAFSKIGKLLDELKAAGVELNLPAADKLKMPSVSVKLPEFKLNITADTKTLPSKTLSTVKAEVKVKEDRIIYDGEFKLNATQQRIIDALGWYESLGNMSPTLNQVGAVALLDPSGGHFSNVTGPLSTQGLIERSSGTISLTDKGRELVQPIEAADSLEGYHKVLKERVRRMKSSGGKTIEMLTAIIAAAGQPITVEELGAAVGIDHTGGHFSNMIGPLSTAGLIKRANGIVTPTDILFPEGLY